MKEIILYIFNKKLYCTIDDNNCYICLNIKVDKKYYRVTYLTKSWQLHRLVYTFYNGVIESDLIVMHTCDNTLCINIDHLIKGTITDNNIDMYTKGRGAVGEKHYRAKLTEYKVTDIRLSNKTQNELAKQYSVPQSC